MVGDVWEVFAEIEISPQGANEYGFNSFTGDIRIGSASNLGIDSTLADASSSGDGASTGVGTCYHSSVDSCPTVRKSLVLFDSLVRTLSSGHFCNGSVQG